MNLRQSGCASNQLIVLRVASMVSVLAGCASAQPPPTQELTPVATQILADTASPLDEVIDAAARQDMLEEPGVPLPRIKPSLPRRLIPRAAVTKDWLATQKPSLPKPKPNRPVAELPVAVAPDPLVGSDYTSVLRVLRQPDAVESETLPVVWTYSESDCTLQLFFYPDIRTTKFHMMKYDLKDSTGEKLGGRGSCMHDIER